jgi:hypothetical protein
MLAPTVLTGRVAVFDRHVLALDVADFFQALAERGQKVWIIAGTPAIEEADYRNFWLLCASIKRNDEETAYNTADEPSPIHH